MSKRGVAVARYDGKDGYANHPSTKRLPGLVEPERRVRVSTARTGPHRTAGQRRGTGEPQVNVEQTGEPFWPTAALLAIASDLGVPDFDIDTFDGDYDGRRRLAVGLRRPKGARRTCGCWGCRGCASVLVWRNRPVRPSWPGKPRRANRQRQSQPSSSSGGGGSSDTTAQGVTHPGGRRGSRAHDPSGLAKRARWRQYRYADRGIRRLIVVRVSRCVATFRHSRGPSDRVPPARVCLRFTENRAHRGIARVERCHSGGRATTARSRSRCRYES